MRKILYLGFVAWLAVAWWAYYPRITYTETMCFIQDVKFDEYKRLYVYNVEYTIKNNTKIHSTTDYGNSYEYFYKVECYYKNDNVTEVTFSLQNYTIYVVFALTYAAYFIINFMIEIYKKREICDCNERRDALNSINHTNIQECVVCLERPKSTRLNCGHVTTCYVCAKKCKKENYGCPICQTPITTMTIGVYTQNDYEKGDDVDSPVI